MNARHVLLLTGLAGLAVLFAYVLGMNRQDSGPEDLLVPEDVRVVAATAKNLLLLTLRFFAAASILSSKDFSIDMAVFMLDNLSYLLY